MKGEVIVLLSSHPFQVNANGHLSIGGLDTYNLVNKYGSPLYVYDVSIIRNNCRAFMKPFKTRGIKGKIAYASKAFSSIAMVQVVDQEGLHLDVVSKGELYTAIKANFPPAKIHLHGNNKSLDEIEMAIKHNIGCIVIDNFYEIELLEQLLEIHRKKMDVLIRVTPGIESETHKYIMTGNEDSKFGFNLHNGQADQAFKRLQHHKRINLLGLHCHIGSQIFEVEQFTDATKILIQKLASWKETAQFIPKVLNVGGGFGIRYTREDQPLPYENYVNHIIDTIKEETKKLLIPLPEIWLEPGRAIAGNAGITLYTIGSQKNIPGIRKYISVDGGMTDNLRPALYNAKYEAIIANKANEHPEEIVSIAGKCCESGDILIDELHVPKIEHGDLLAIFSTGAYGYSMASHYNRFPKPAVVFVENGKDQLIIKRESYKDVVDNDLKYKVF